MVGQVLLDLLAGALLGRLQPVGQALKELCAGSQAFKRGGAYPARYVATACLLDAGALRARDADGAPDPAEASDA